MTRLNTTNAVRNAVRQGYSWDEAAQVYANTSDTLLALNERISGQLSDPATSGELHTVYALSRYKAAAARQGALLIGAANTGQFPTTAVAESFKIAVDQQRDQSAVFQNNAGSEAKSKARDAQVGSQSTLIDDARDLALKTGGKKLQVSGADLLAGEVAQNDKLQKVENFFLARQIARAADLRSKADKAASLFLLGATLALLFAAAVAIFAGRSRTSSTRSLPLMSTARTRPASWPRRSTTCRRCPCAAGQPVRSARQPLQARPPGHPHEAQR